MQRFCVRLARRYASDPGDAEDIAQDALLRAWRRRSTLRDASRRKEWLATIVRNEAFREHSKVRPEPVAELEVVEYDDEDETIFTAERAGLHAAIKGLNERDRMILLLRYGEDLTQQAIARRLGLPDGTVKVRLHRLRHQLRKVLLEAREQSEDA
jgi:RNA polymerase sigma-70 factor, ECF subfamily